MATIQNTFEGGALGSDITVAGSGGLSGTAFNNVIISNATLAEATYTSTKMHGSVGAYISGNGSNAYLEWTGLATKTLSSRFYVRVPSYPSAEAQIFTPRNSTNYIGTVNLRTNGGLKVTGAFSGGGATLFQTTGVLALNTWYRVEVSWGVGTTTTNGSVNFKYFVGDSTTAVESFSSAAIDAGTTNVTIWRIGKTANSGTLSMNLDSIGYNDASTTLMGPYVQANIPPIADAGLGQTGVVPGTLVTLDGSYSFDPDGIIESYAWTQTAGTTVELTGTGSGRQFLAPSVAGGTNLTFQLTVTDDEGATDTATVNYSVASPGGSSNQVQNTFEGGTNGTTITTANSGGASGTPFDYIEIGSGAGMVYSTATAAHGTKSMLASGNAVKAFAEYSVGPTPKLTTRTYFRMPALPTAANNIIVIRNSSAQAASIIVSTAGVLRVADATGASIHDTPALNINQWYRIEAAWEPGASTTTGKVWFGLYSGDSTTAIDSWSSTTANFGTAPMALFRFGKYDNAGNNSFYFDSVTYDPTSTTLLGPHVALNIAPTANAGTSLEDVEPGTVVTLDGSGSADPNGTITTYLWEQQIGATVTISGTGSTRTFTAPYTLAGDLLAFKLTVTDNNGATAESSVTYTVLPCMERAVIGGVEVPLIPKAVIGGTLV